MELVEILGSSPHGEGHVAVAHDPGTRARHRGGRMLASVLGLAISGSVLASVAAAAPVATHRFAVPSWQTLTYEATKLLVRATSEVRIDEEVADPGSLAVAPVADVRSPRGPHLLRLEVSSKLLGRRASIVTQLDPKGLGALQQVKVETGRKHHRKVERFTEGGVYSWRQRPASRQGARRDPTTWPQEKEGFHRHAQPVSGVSVPSALFLLLADPALTHPGDRVVIPMFSRRRLDTVTVTVVARDRVQVPKISGGPHLPAQGSVEVLRVRVDADGAREEGASSFRFLGLRGSVTLDLEPNTRVPLVIRGRAPGLGAVQVRLQAVTWRSAG